MRREQPPKPTPRRSKRAVPYNEKESAIEHGNSFDAEKEQANDACKYKISKNEVV